MSTNSSISDEELVEALKKGETSAFEQVYAQYFRMAASFVQQNHGDDEEARDTFQEMLFVLVKKLREKDFHLSSKLGTYIYSIIRHLWLRRLKKRGNFQLMDLNEQQDSIAITDDEIEVKKEVERKHELMANVLESLKDDCKKIILSSFYEKKSHKEIAEIMDYTLAFVRVKLHRCMESFRKKVRNHPDYNAL